MAMLVILIGLVAITVTVVAVLAGFKLATDSQRRALPPARPPLPGPSPWQGFQGQPGPRYPAYNPAQYLSPGDRERINVMLRGGHKIQAIKLYRQSTGAGLAEAKAAVEHLERYQ
ncbi:hypothetical protein [Granulicoccus sp. GXG6511]|uniref:hypothetical protein n=1 Tax=Granulicoccus sp. GXG6511 TaxID=3381351 RepID=UPI003D7CA3FA